jgi:hypothetical protein
MSTAAKEYKAKKLKETSKYTTRVYNRCNRCVDLEDISDTTVYVEYALGN